MMVPADKLFVLAYASSDNDIGAEGGRALAESLVHDLCMCSSVSCSSLGNSLGSEGACALSEALKQNMTLTTLILAGTLEESRLLFAPAWWVPAHDLNLLICPLFVQ